MVDGSAACACQAFGTVPRMSAHLITADLQPLQGTVGERRGEEVLARQPAGTGTFVWVQVAKDGISTAQAADALARAAQADPACVGCAGLRDRGVRFVQWFSLPVEACGNAGALRRAGAHGRMQVLALSAGHQAVGPETVRAVHWRVRLVGAKAGDGFRRARILTDRLRTLGLPNRFHAARFGREGELARWGLLLLQGRRLPDRVRGGADAGRCLQAVQGWLFNRWLAGRTSLERLAGCVVGDLLRGNDGSEKLVEDVAHGRRRLECWEATVLGPCFGAGMAPCAGEAAAEEAQVLVQAGLEPDQVLRLRGGRRALRVQPQRLVMDVEGDDLILDCELPVEAYIDCLLEELIR